ncbi:MAG: hypothetical protein ACJ8DI_10910, partial [Ktedonobacteraceae bacterium]
KRTQNTQNMYYNFRSPSAPRLYEDIAPTLFLPFGMGWRTHSTTFEKPCSPLNGGYFAATINKEWYIAFVFTYH